MSQGELFERVLLIGPAGCGKTHRILELYLRELEAGREERVLLVVPTASFREHTRNKVLRSGKAPAFSGHSVVTFADLVVRNNIPELSSARRELIVRRLLGELDLPYLRKVVEFPGFRGALVEEAEEVLAAGHTAEDLERPLGPSERGKAFVKFLRAYQAATACFRQPAVTERKPDILLVDGFTDFTMEQKKLLTTLAASAAEAAVTLPLDCEPARQFLHGLGFRETTLEGNRRPLPASASLVALENVLRGQAAALEDDSAITVHQAGDRREEVDWVAREILDLARNRKYPYREICLVVQNPSAYLPLIRDLFPRYGIPMRVFFPCSISETAMGRHLLACLDLFRPDAASFPEAVLAILKSPYSPVEKREVIEELEYGMMEHRAQAEAGEWKACLRGKPFWALEKFFAALESLRGQLTAAKSDSVKLGSWLGAVWETFTLRHEIAAGIPHSRALDLRADAQAWSRALALLEEVTEAVKAEKTGFEFADFTGLLREEMAQARFRVRDRRHDVVYVMNTYEARQWELRAVFVLGLVEKEFPRPARRTLFLDDPARQLLHLPASPEHAGEERRQFYVAATRARERLSFSYPSSDARGAAFLKSFFLEDVERLLPKPARKRKEGATAVSGKKPERPARPGSLTLPENLSRIRDEQVRFSATQFKDFGQCAFKHFAAYVLRLKGPPKQAEGLTYLLRGGVIHETLRVWEVGGRAEPIAQVFERCFASGTRDLPIGHAEESLRAQMREDLEHFVAAEANHSAVYRTAVDPALIEKTFGGGDGPIIEWKLSDGSLIQIRGRLDRVETADTGKKKLGVVVDFKYSKNGFDAKRLGAVEQGQEFQIPLYLLALQEVLGMEPAGAELYTLRGEPRRAGVFAEDVTAHVFRGEAPEGTELLSREEFRKLLVTARQKMEEYAARIRTGEIEVRPFDTRYCRKGGCDFFDLCRVNKWEQR